MIEPPIREGRARVSLLDQVAAAVSGYRFTYATEAQLHDGVEEAIRLAGLAVEREHVVPPGSSRLDLLVEGSVAVEIKLRGSVRDVGAQIVRYLECDYVDGLVLVTGRASHAALAGPAVRVVTLGMQGL